MNTVKLLSKGSINLRTFLENTVKDYGEIDRCLKNTFNNSKQYHCRTEYKVKADFDNDIVTAQAALFLYAEEKFKRSSRGFFHQAQYYKGSEISKIFREAIEEHNSESECHLTIFNKYLGKYDIVSFGIEKKVIYQKQDFSEELLMGWDEITEKLKKIATISQKLGICAEIIDAVQINNHYRSYSSEIEGEAEKKEDRLERLQRLSPKALLNAKEIISELESLQKDYKGLDKWTLNKDITKFVNDIIYFLAPKLEKADSGLFPGEYYKVPGGKDPNGKDSDLFTEWTSNYLTHE